jgi:hypothetical protein
MEYSHDWPPSQRPLLQENKGSSNRVTSSKTISTVVPPEHTYVSTNPSLHRPIRKVVLLSLLLSIFLLGLLAIFGGYIWSHVVQRSGAIVSVSISNNTILFISTIISRIPPLLVPVAMGFAAYNCAREWLIYSAAWPLHHSSQPSVVAVPTPEQYNIALRVLGNGGLGAAWAAIRYLVTASRRKAGIVRRPRWLDRSIILLFFLTFIAYLIGGIDLWLHKEVVSVRLTTFEKSKVPTTSMSRTINYTYCDVQLSQRGDNSYPCTSVTQGAHLPFMIFPDEGLATVTNTSNLHEVVLLPDSSIALLLPSSQIRSTNTYIATTFGTYTTCAPVSLECNLYAESGASTPYACVEYPEFRGDMSYVASGSSTIANFNGSGTRGVGGPSTDLGAWSQPLEFGIAALLQSSECHLHWGSCRLC